MNEDSISREERVLRVCKQVLTSVARDTATQPGIKHPLSGQTLDDLRACLFLISEREKELVEARGESMDMRPELPGDNKPQGDVVVPITRVGRPSKPDQ